MSNELRNFISKSTHLSKKSINDSYRSIDLLYYELDVLNDHLATCMNKKTSYTFDIYEKQEKLAKIRERIPEVYKEINYYKECINAERIDMNRIYDTYDVDIMYDDDYLSVNDVEEIENFKYNTVNDTFEPTYLTSQTQ